jgi:hypothetical protein
MLSQLRKLLGRELLVVIFFVRMHPIIYEDICELSLRRLLKTLNRDSILLGENYVLALVDILHEEAYVLSAHGWSLCRLIIMNRHG